MSKVKSRLEEARDFMQDFALPPGLGIGITEDKRLVVIREATSEIMELDATEEDVGNVAVSLWREYLQEASPAVLVRFVQCILSVDALLAHEGELEGGPRGSQYDEEGEEHHYQCVLWGKGGQPWVGCGGYDNDPVNAILKARRSIQRSLEDQKAPSSQKESLQELQEKLRGLPAFKEHEN